MKGNCLNCGKPAYSQDHCDECSDDPMEACKGCGKLFPKYYRACHEHTIDELKKTINVLRKSRSRLLEGYKATEVRLKAQTAELEKKVEELESRLRYKEGLLGEVRKVSPSVLESLGEGVQA